MEKTNPKTGQYYEIKVKGHTDLARLAELDELDISLLPEGQTLITGRLVDQAALFGILIRIRDMGITLVSVNSRKTDETA